MYTPIRPFEPSPAFLSWLNQVCNTEEAPPEPVVKTRKPRSPSRPRQTNPAKGRVRIQYELVG